MHWVSSIHPSNAFIHNNAQLRLLLHLRQQLWLDGASVMHVLHETTEHQSTQSSNFALDTLPCAILELAHDI